MHQISMPGGHPKWWTPEAGRNVSVKQFDRPNRTVVLTTLPHLEGYDIEIVRALPEPGKQWQGEHLIKCSNTLIKRVGCKRDCKVWSRIRLTQNEMIWAFHPEPPRDYHPGVLELRTTADIYLPCKFIRQGPHLNLLGPGTGEYPDPNLSIFLSSSIIQAVQNLLALPS